MPKTVNVNVVKALDVLPGHKYLLILPSYIVNDPNVGKAITALFADNPYVGLIVKNPDDIKIIDAGEQKDGETNRENN